MQERRNDLLHGAEIASRVEAEQAIAVAEAILEQLFPAVMKRLGLHLHDGPRICWGYCELRRSTFLPQSAAPAK